MKIDDVIEKIRKLRALSQSANEHEAAAAAGAAERLMAEHRIAEAELEAHAERADTQEKAMETPEPVTVFDSKIPTWKWNLIWYLTDLHGCDKWIAHKTTRGADGVWEDTATIRITGRESDAAMVRYLYAWLSVEIERLAQKFGKGRGRTWMNSYRLGCVSGINQAMRKAEHAARATVTSAALVKLDARKAEAEALQKALHPDIRKSGGSARSNINGAAYRTGQDHGANLQQRSALPTSAGARRLGSGR